LIKKTGELQQIINELQIRLKTCEDELNEEGGIDTITEGVN
jgi:hypothetical protein